MSLCTLLFVLSSRICHHVNSTLRDRTQFLWVSTYPRTYEGITFKRHEKDVSVHYCSSIHDVRFFFCEIEEMKESHTARSGRNQKQAELIQPASKGQDHASPAWELPVNFMGGRGRTICTLRTTEIQQGRSHSPGGDTGEHGRPPQAPSLFQPLPHQDGFWLSPSFGNLVQERPGLSWPPSTDFSSEDNQRGSAPSANQFGVGSFFSATSSDKGTTSSSGVLLMGWPLACRIPTNVVSTASCRPPYRGRPSTTTSSRRASPTWGNSMSKSRSMMLVRTRPPPSLQMRATTLSTAKPLSPNTALAHAARWWPRASRGRPHRQLRADKGRGWRRRLKSTTRKRWDSIWVKWHEGVVAKARPAMGPPCERTNASAFSEIWGNKTVSRKDLDTASCHPERCDPGSNSSGSPHWGSLPCHQLSPRWGFESHHPCQSSNTFDHFPQARCRRIPFKLKDQFSCHGWVSLPDHGEAIRPAGPESSTPHPRGWPQPHASQDQKQRSCVTAPASHNSGGRLRISHRQCHKLLSCLAAKGDDNDGWTPRSKKFARASAQWSNKSHADWIWGTAGIRSSNVACSADFRSMKVWWSRDAPQGFPRSWSLAHESPTRNLATPLPADLHFEQFAPAHHKKQVDFQPCSTPWSFSHAPWDPSVGEKCLLEDGVHTANPLWLWHHVHVVQEGRQPPVVGVVALARLARPHAGPKRTREASKHLLVLLPHLDGHGEQFLSRLPTSRKMECHQQPHKRQHSASLVNVMKALEHGPSWYGIVSTDSIKIVAVGFISHSPWITWATHSHPARVERAYWKGTIAASTSLTNYLAMVRETNRRNRSPATMPLTPPVRFPQNSDPPHSHNVHSLLRHFSMSLELSKRGRKCS